MVHINCTLIHAHSPTEAYEKSVKLGSENELSYQNKDGKNVSIKFRGLRDLMVVHDDLEHGAELFYDEKVGISETKLSKLILSKEELSVFAPRKGWSQKDYPDYVAGDIVKELREAGVDINGDSNDD